jgi:hypothetical protein
VKLRQALVGCSTGLLRRIAANRGFSADVATLHGELVERLGADLGRAARTGDLWRQLAGDQRATIGLLAASGGRQGAELFERRLRRRLAAPPSQVLAGLVDHGVVFRVFEAVGTTGGAVYLLPDEYLASATNALPAGAPVGQLSPAPEPEDVYQSDPGLDCFVLASALRREVWNLTGRRLGGRSRRSVQQVLSRLRASSPDVDDSRADRRWTFFLRIGRRLGWLRGDGWPVPDDAALLDLLGGGSVPVGRFWRAHLGTGGEATRSAGGPSGPRGEARASLRRDVLQLLGELRPGRWYRRAELARAVAAELGVPGPSGNAGSQLDRDRAGGSLALPAAAGPARPETVDAVDAWLAGPWYWLGLVRWGRDAGDWTLVSTTPALARLAAEPQLSTEEPGGSVACQLGDDLGLTAPSGADLAALYRSERYLTYLGGVAERRYRLTAPSFARGIRLGGSVAELTELLTTLARAPLPSAWTEALATWDSSLGQLRLDARIVLSAASDEIFRRVVESPSVREAFDEPMSDRHASVPPERLGALLEALTAAGLAVELGTGLRLEPTRPNRAVGLGADAVTLLWVLLEALRRIDPAIAGQLAGGDEVRAALEAVVPISARPALEQRAEALARRLAGRRPGAAGRRAADSMV